MTIGRITVAGLTGAAAAVAAVMLEWSLSPATAQQSGGAEPQSAQRPVVGIMQGRSAAPRMPRFERANIANGRAVVVGAAGAANPPTGSSQALPCFSCHGLHGAGDGTGAFPRLSGQPAFYLYKQLVDYASGARPNDVMTPIAQALSQAEMEDVAAFYAAQRGAPAFPPAQPDPLVLQQGGVLSAVGSAEKGIPACVNCHGPQGRGLPPSFPYLAGQYALYTELQLQLWQQGQRGNDPLDVMADIAGRMSPEDIRGVAAYFAAMPPPGAAVASPAGAPGASPPR